MRRRSLAGPLLLIVIGAWFLASTMRPELPLLEVAARYWPFLLVGWGAVRLLEIFLWKMRGKPLPCAGISGGEWALVVILCMVGSGLYAANYYRPWSHLGMITANRVEIFGRSYDYNIPEIKKDSGEAKRVLIENLRGNVRITGGDVKEITAGGRKSIRTLKEPDADAANRQTPVEITVNGEQVVIRTNQDRITGDRKISTDLEVTVPRKLMVEVRGRNGDVEINDLNAPVEVSCDTASVRLENVGGNVRLDLHDAKLVRASNVKGAFELQGGHGGDIELDTVEGEVTINGSYSGNLDLRNLAKPVRIQGPNSDVRVEQVPGQIHMELGQFTASNLVGPIRLTSSRRRDVQIEQFTNSLEMQLDHGDINLRPMHVPVPKIDAKTREGEVEITLPENAKFELKAVTRRGEVSNNFGPALKTEADDREEDRRGGSVTGAVGQGPAVVVETDRGSLTVRKDSGAPLTAKNGKRHEDHVKIDTDKGSLEVEKH